MVWVRYQYSWVKYSYYVSFVSEKLAEVFVEELKSRSDVTGACIQGPPTKEQLKG